MSKKSRRLWVSCSESTGAVTVNPIGKIVDVPPIWIVFKYQPYRNLEYWLRKKFTNVRIISMPRVSLKRRFQIKRWNQV